MTIYPRKLSELLGTAVVSVNSLMKRLESGESDVNQWSTEFSRQLAKWHTSAIMLGEDSAELSDRARQTVTQNLKGQLEYLKNWEAEIKDTDEFKKSWYNRAALYAQGIKQEYWSGNTKFLPLPAMPGDGTTQCLGNCNCHWRIEWVNEANGDADCYWVMGSGDHCQTCSQRASDWSPLKIRGNEPIDYEPDISTELSDSTDTSGFKVNETQGKFGKRLEYLLNGNPDAFITTSIRNDGLRSVSLFHLPESERGKGNGQKMLLRALEDGDIARESGNGVSDAYRRVQDALIQKGLIKIIKDEYGNEIMTLAKPKSTAKLLEDIELTKYLQKLFGKSNGRGVFGLSAGENGFGNGNYSTEGNRGLELYQMDSTDINGLLRHLAAGKKIGRFRPEGGDLTRDEINEAIDGLRKLFRDEPTILDQDVVFYRGLNKPIKPGEEFSDPAFTSLTTERAVAATFGNVVKVLVPAGTPMAIGGNHISEVLLNENSRFRVNPDGSLTVITGEKPGTTTEKPAQTETKPAQTEVKPSSTEKIEGWTPPKQQPGENPMDYRARSRKDKAAWVKQHPDHELDGTPKKKVTSEKPAQSEVIEPWSEPKQQPGEDFSQYRTRLLKDRVTWLDQHPGYSIDGKPLKIKDPDRKGSKTFKPISMNDGESAHDFALRYRDAVIQFKIDNPGQDLQGKKIKAGELVVTESDHPKVKAELEFYQKIPVKLRKFIESQGISLYLGSRSMGKLDENSDVANQQPQGWPPGSTFDGIGGMYRRDTQKINVSVTGSGASRSGSPLLHEFGHAVDHAVGYIMDVDLDRLHKQIYSQLSPYLQQGGPGGAIGKSELFAELFAAYIVNPQLAKTLFGDSAYKFMKREMERWNTE